MSDPERLVISADVANVSVARRFVRRALADAPPEVADDLQLAVSELVTNAVEHGHGDEVTITVDSQTPRFTVAVTSADADADIDPDDEWSVAEVTARTGRGLGIVREVVDDIDVRRRGQELTITVVRDATGRSVVA